MAAHDTQYRRLQPDASGRLVDDSLFDVYTLATDKGLQVSLDLISNDFDPILVVVDPQGQLLLHNDDENPKHGTASAVSFHPSQVGVYQVWVTSNGGGGEYRIRSRTEDHREPTKQLQVGRNVEGWLTPADELDEKGRHMDRWHLALPSHPVAVLAKSKQLDVFLKAFSANGDLLVWNNDIDTISGYRDAFLYLAPTPSLPAGKEVTIEVGALGDRVTGVYSLSVWEFPQEKAPEMTLTLRILRVKGAEGKGGTTSTPEQIKKVFERAQGVWEKCGIRLALDSEILRPPLHIPGIEGIVRVDSDAWTQQELALFSHPESVGPAERVVTVFVVRGTDGGEDHALAYPTTQYSPGRIGIIMSDAAIQKPANDLVLAHEIGHILGLPHAMEGNGDSPDVIPKNVMFIAGHHGMSPVGALSPLQCAIARRAPHFLVPAEGAARRQESLFQRHDKVLAVGEKVDASLRISDQQLVGGQYYDLYYFEGKAGDVVRLDASSQDFDAFLLVEALDGERIAEDDDGGEGLNASLTFTLAQDGDYVIGVTTPQAGAVGAYTLEMSRPQAPLP